MFGQQERAESWHGVQMSMGKLSAFISLDLADILSGYHTT